MQEKLNHSPETIHVRNTEELVAVTGSAVDDCERNPGLCARSHNVDILHDDVVRSDFGSVFKKYENHEAIRLTDIQESINKILNALQQSSEILDEEDEEKKLADNSENLLKERVKIIDDQIRAYIATLQQFYLIKKQQFRLEPDVYIDKIQDIDSRRRRSHDALIGSLTVYNDTVNSLQEYGLLDDFSVKEWSLGARSENDDKTIDIFSTNFLSDRDLIKDWALSAHMFGQLSKINDLQKNDSE